MGEQKMNEASHLRQLLGRLFASQRLAVLATQSAGQPYSNLVAFCEAGNLQYLLFATSRNTRKYANLVASPLVSLLIDSRSNQDSDFREAIAVTAIGRAEEVKGPEKERLLRLYLEKHPHLAEFVKSPDNTLFRVKVSDYKVVSEFQRVRGLHIQD